MKSLTIQWPNEKGQTTIHKALHRKLKIEQHEPRLQLGVNSGAPEKFADPHPHTPIESLLQ